MKFLQLKKLLLIQKSKKRGDKIRGRGVDSLVELMENPHLAQVDIYVVIMLV